MLLEDSFEIEDVSSSSLIDSMRNFGVQSNFKLASFSRMSKMLSEFGLTASLFLVIFLLRSLFGMFHSTDLHVGINGTITATQ